MSAPAPTFRAASPLSSVYGTGSATAAPVVPSSVQSGDILLLFFEAANGASYPVTPTLPSGWTVEANVVQGQVAYAFKVATAADAGATVDVTVANTGQPSYWISVGAVIAAYSTATGVDIAITGGGATSPAVTTSQDNETVVECWALRYSGSGYSAPPATARVNDSVSDGGGEYWTFQVSDQAAATAGSYGSVDNTVLPGPSSIAVALKGVLAPSVPTITEPTNASTMDMSGAVPVAWDYNPTAGDGAQSAIGVRRKANGGSSYEYWSAGTSAWQSSDVDNDDVNPDYTFPVGAWGNGVVWNLSVRTVEGTYGLSSLYAPDITVTAQAPPTCTITGPTGVVATSSPTITLSVSPASGAQVTAYRVVVYSAAQVAAPGFTPGSAPNLWDSGTVAVSTNPSAIDVTVPAGAIPNGSTPTAYAEVTETGSETSSWVSGSFTVSVDAPATPTVTAAATTDPSTGLPMIAVTVQGHDNLLTADDASFEGGVGTAAAVSNCSVAQSSAEALDGSYSLAATSSAAGAMAWREGPYPVVAGQSYQAMGYYRPAATVENVRTDVMWYDGSTLLAIATGAEVAEGSTGGWTVSVATLTAPAGATQAYLLHNVLSTAAASEVHYLDCAGLFPARVTTPADANLVPDSDFRFPLNTVGQNDATKLGWNNGSGGPWTTADGVATYTSTAAGNPGDLPIASPASAPIPVTPGDTMTLAGVIDAAGLPTGAGVIDLGIWDTGIGVAYTYAGQAAGTSGTVELTWTVPTGVTEVRVAVTFGLTFTAAGQSFSVSQPQLTATSTAQPYSQGPTWTRGGLVGAVSAIITRSDGLQVRGASTANPAPIPSGTQQVVVNDPEPTPGVSYTYTAVADATIAGVPITSPASTASAAASVTTTTWWTVDPTDLTTAIPLDVQSHQTSQMAQQTAHTVLGPPNTPTYPTVVSSAVGGQDGTLGVQTNGAAEYTAVLALVKVQATMFLSSPFGDALYVRYGPPPGGMSGSGAGNKTHDTQTVTSPASQPVRQATLNYIEQGRPAV